MGLHKQRTAESMGFDKRGMPENKGFHQQDMDGIPCFRKRCRQESMGPHARKPTETYKLL